MVQFFKKGQTTFFAVETDHRLTPAELEKLSWAFSGAKPLSATSVKGRFVGPRREMITPWSTNAVEITQNMGLSGITRIEQFERVAEDVEPVYDRMLSRLYDGLNSKVFAINRKPDPIVRIENIHEYNLSEGLALSADEEAYLESLSRKLGRPLTDSEVFGFSQVNSEHCRHKIFNGTFVIDGEEKPMSLFKLIKKTSQENPNGLVSAYKDNVAFLEGPVVDQFYPVNPDRPDYFEVKDVKTVISLKAETHNFPTTVEPFNGAATGTGGEIRDRLGGGKASLPIAGTAVYMTSYPRLSLEHRWELMMNPRVWLYQTPAEILIKASNGASDFGNKFGQPLICGSLLTFEHEENDRKYAYDKVIMLAGGVGYAAKKDAIKGTPEAGEKVVVMGGDNYRIGMGGGAVSSVETGQYDNSIELNAVQRANPEMQKRVANVIRALAESDNNPVVSIHDHGAGGHLNALSELVEATGGRIDIDALPVGDPTLSAKEIVGNESQERMGLVIKAEDIPYVERVAQRERAPMYVVGETTGDDRFVFEDKNGVKPIDLEMADMFGNSPKTVMTDTTVDLIYKEPEYNESNLLQYVEDVLSLEAVACKDWLTNKVDRSVTGKVARQQCQGQLQLPLSDCGVVALDYTGKSGIATSIGHAPQVALADSAKGSVMAVAEALTNIAGAQLEKGLKSVSLSANWMWPCKNQGEDAALYKAVEACSDFACALGINIPTGKDSLSMTQKYGDDKVFAPGTVIISAAGQTGDVRRTVTPVLQNKKNTLLYYIDFSSDALRLGGSAFAQALNRIGSDAPTVKDPARFAAAFAAVQKLVKGRKLLAMHDVSAGGLVTTLLEMLFANTAGGLEFTTSGFLLNGETDLIKILFAENPAVVIQFEESKKESVEKILADAGVKSFLIGKPSDERVLLIEHYGEERLLGIDHLRDRWFEPSYLLDSIQSGKECAALRFENYKKQPLRYLIPASFDGSLASRGLSYRRDGKSGVKAAIIREKGVNGDREMAYSLYLAGFDVKDVHMTDLMTGRETLEDVNMIVFCGGFSNSDVLGSAKGWASGFLWNDTAKETLRKFYEREDTLSLGICNGCQLMVELGLIPSAGKGKPTMEHNISHKFESQFLGLTIPANNSVMLGSLAGMKLGIWVAHGEGRFNLPGSLKDYNIAAKYNYAAYPANPNGSRGAVAAIASPDGRHLAMMPHLERAIFPWQCGYYPYNRRNNEVTPWIDAFVNARKWIEEKTR
ncbi:MAG: phosphoribosylformylglycinamidine synthase [Muribaculaceae bacterium]|nr:phosphoribosylformylglycinamidine synthase [Muribaculaceae bacterium]